MFHKISRLFDRLSSYNFSSEITFCSDDDKLISVFIHTGFMNAVIYTGGTSTHLSDDAWPEEIPVSAE